MRTGGEHPHLTLLKAEDTRNRRKQLAPPRRPPNPERREEIAVGISNQVSNIETVAAEKPTAFRRIDPSLVFRVKLSEKVGFDELDRTFGRADIRLVSRESAQAVIAFKSDSDLSKFKESLEAFRTPSVNNQGVQSLSTVYDVFQFIEPEGLEPYGRIDRIGPRLAVDIGPEGENIDNSKLYVADVELWHSASEIDAIVTRVERVINLNQHSVGQGTLFEAGHSRICDKYVGHGLTILRVKVAGDVLSRLLDHGDIAEIDLPPRPSFDPFELVTASLDEFAHTPPPEDSVRVCVIDSGVNAAHPVLSPFVAHAEAFLTKTSTATDVHGHGTAVGGIAVFGDIHAHFQRRTFKSDVLLCSARILNENLELDDEKLFISQVRAAVRFFKEEPYSCRVFNLSFGTFQPALGTATKKQSAWASQLDDLAKQENILFVVSAGNRNLTTNNRQDAERVLRMYPDYLFEDEAGICDPGTSALALTVGSVANSITPAIASFGNDDVKQAVAGLGEPSPFSRTGFGCNDGVKPDFVHYGGNLLFDRGIKRDAGLGVMVLNSNAQASMFRVDVGTSFAAPRVARAAARTWRALEGMLGQEPTPNLVRSVLAATAETRTVREQFGEWPSDKHLRSMGFGIPNEDLATESINSDLILIYEGEIAVDGFQLFEVPMPPAMIGASGVKRVTCALSFDPETNARRRDYLAVEMDMNLFRGIEANDLITHYEAVGGDREARRQAPTSLQDRRRCKLMPILTKVEHSTLQRRQFTTQRLRSDDGESYFLMVTCYRNWGEFDSTQRFALAVRLTANSDLLYNQVRSRVQQRILQRVRA